MMIARLTFLFCLLVFSASTYSQTATEVRAERLALAAAPGFDSGDLMEIEMAAHKEATALWKRGKHPEAYKRLLALLQKYPISIVGHATAAKLLKEFVDGGKKADIEVISDKFEFHSSRVRIIEDSIIGTTQCTKPADDCRVITMIEIYHATGRLGVDVQDSKYQLINDVPFYVVKVLAQSGSEQTLYFNVSAFPQRWRK